MTLLVKDANTTVQALSTGLDSAGALVPVHTLAAVVGGIATPVSALAPMPVVNAAGTPAADGSGAVITGGAAQLLFGGMVPVNGYLVANNSTATLYICDVGVAGPGGASIALTPGGIFATPSGYKPAGAVSLYGATSGQAFAARRW